MTSEADHNMVRNGTHKPLIMGHALPEVSRCAARSESCLGEVTAGSPYSWNFGMVCYIKVGIESNVQALPM